MAGSGHLRADAVDVRSLRAFGNNRGWAGRDRPTPVPETFAGWSIVEASDDWGENCALARSRTPHRRQLIAADCAEMMKRLNGSAQ